MSRKQEHSTSAPQYPNPDEIEATFTKVETPEELKRLQELFAEDFHGVVTGHDHSFVGEHYGHGSWFAQLSSILASLDHEKTFKLDIVRVIGGGSSPWACLEGKATAKTKTGESFVIDHFVSLHTRKRKIGNSCWNRELGNDYNNEFVWVMHFNTEGKIDKARAYYDSAHMEGLAKEMNAQK